MNGWQKERVDIKIASINNVNKIEHVKPKVMMKRIDSELVKATELVKPIELVKRIALQRLRMHYIFDSRHTEHLEHMSN